MHDSTLLLLLWRFSVKVLLQAGIKARRTHLFTVNIQKSLPSWWMKLVCVYNKPMISCLLPTQNKSIGGGSSGSLCFTVLCHYPSPLSLYEYLSGPRLCAPFFLLCSYLIAVAIFFTLLFGFIFHPGTAGEESTTTRPAP